MDKALRFFNRGYRLYAVPSTLSGAARVLDLGGTFDAYNTSRTGAEADWRAIESDWLHIGDDLRSALIASIGDLSRTECQEFRKKLEKQRTEKGTQLRLLDA